MGRLRGLGWEASSISAGVMGRMSVLLYYTVLEGLVSELNSALPNQKGPVFVAHGH